MKRKILQLVALSLVTMGLSVAVATVKADDFSAASLSPFDQTPFKVRDRTLKDQFTITDYQIQALESTGRVTVTLENLVSWQRSTEVEISILTARGGSENGFIYLDKSLLTDLKNGEKIPVLFTDGTGNTRKIYLKKLAVTVPSSDDAVPTFE